MSALRTDEAFTGFPNGGETHANETPGREGAILCCPAFSVCRMSVRPAALQRMTGEKAHKKTQLSKLRFWLPR